MSAGRAERSSAALVAVGVVGLLVLAGALLRGPRRDAGSPAPTLAATLPAATPTAPRPTLASAGPQADPSALAGAIDGFLGGVPVATPPSPREVLASALARPSSPLDYRKSLEDAIRRNRGGAQQAAKLLTDGLGEADDALRFQHAQALARHLDAPAVETLLAGLETAPAAARPWIAFALRGTREPRVGDALVGLYTGDVDPAVRAQAGFVLGEGRWSPLAVERAKETARLDLAGEDPRLVKTAGDVLGLPPLSDPDRELLTRTLQSRGSDTRRLAALRALAANEVRPEELAPLLESVARDSSAGDALRRAVEELRAAARGESGAR